MSWQTWVFIIVGFLAVLVAAVATPMAFRIKDRYDRELARNVSIGAGVVYALAGLIFLSGSFTIVGTRQIAIETSFNRPNGTVLENGIHWKAPWDNTSEMDGAIQIDKYDQDNSRIKVRLGNNSTAGADTSIRWQIKPEAAPELFVQYKTFDNVRVNLIERNLQVALNEVFQTFDPLASQWEHGVPLQTFANKAADHLRGIVGSQVQILDISVSRMQYDDETEKKINQLNGERANTAVAQQSEKTAEAQAKANEKLKQSISNDPNIIANNCTVAAIAKGISPFGCWPNAQAVPTLPVGK